MRPLDPQFQQMMRDRIEKLRETIDVEGIVMAFAQCVVGSRDLTKEQIKAGEILLRKCMPDLKAIEHTAGPGLEDFADYLAKARERAARTTASRQQH